MLTEPLTTPPTRILRIIYGALVGLMFAPQIHIGSIYTTPELALIIGNIFSYLVSPKYKLVLTLKEKIKLTDDIYDFVFVPDKQISFTPGQYMEWTLEHPKSDDRGNRRYLSLASSPTEKEIRIGVKVGYPSSSFKRGLLALTPGQKIVAGQLIGDFALPKDPNKKLVFIAGGIGITPFRSMIKYLTDTNQRRDIVIVYSSSLSSDFVYKNVFNEAQEKLGIRTIYVDTQTQGHMDAARVAREIPDYKDRTFYISGSHGMVNSFGEILGNLHIPAGQVITDYFPGFA
jgi:ferredoxin-NADP reductase